MPTINRIGKETTMKHHKVEPFWLVEPVEALLYRDNKGAVSGNLIVQGDDLRAVKTWF